MCHLRASLKGEAANIIDTMDTTNHNNTIAWDTLEDRYDNKHRNIYSHINSIQELNQVRQIQLY